MEQNTNPAAGAAKRPTFLTVLCILTFVGVAFSLYSSFSNYSEAKKMATEMGPSVSEMIDQSAGADSLGEAGKELAKSMANAILGHLDWNKIATGYLIIGLLNIVVLAGAAMMWMLKKMGFYIYAVGELAQVVVLFATIGGAIGGVMGIVSGIFAVLFIILYALNLKHMK
ncbi:MAG: hypothetical protein Fur0041_15930 [Bacteroidia bacterium]